MKDIQKSNSIYFIFFMFTKLLAFFCIITIVYIGTIFMLPEIADTYGMKSWNDTIRSLKAKLDTDNAHFGSGKTLIDGISDIAKPYIDESRAVTKQVQETVTTKTEQVKKAADSVEKAYQAVEWAKKDVQKLTDFWTGSR